MTTAAEAPQEAAKGENPWFIAAAVMFATFMEVLDTSIAAVALPYIAGSLSASNDEATWVLTSYLVSNAIVLPASNWCSLKFGRKRFLMSLRDYFHGLPLSLCGAAPTLAFMLAARVMQGCRWRRGLAAAFAGDFAGKLSAERSVARRWRCLRSGWWWRRCWGLRWVGG